MKLKLLYNISIALFAMALLSACTDQVEEPLLPGREISLFSRANEGDAASSAYLMFWRESDYNSFYSGQNPADKPYTTADMPQDIDAYSDPAGTPFNTFRPYPMTKHLVDAAEVYDYVYAAGFAPSNAFVKTFTSGYCTVPIATNHQKGLTDFLASTNDGSCKGSYEDQFVEEGNATYNTPRMLKFHHLTACISFVAMRSSGMYDKIGVKDVTVEIINDGADNIKKLAVPKSIQVYHNSTNTKWTYRVYEETTPAQLTGYVPGSVPMVEGKQLAEFYVNTAGIAYGEDEATEKEFDPFVGVTIQDSTNPTLKVNIQATLFWVQDPSQEWENRWENLVVQDWDLLDPENDVKTGDRFLPGYKYQITINFDNTAIGLKAVQLPWKPGGTYYYPVWSQAVTP